MRKYVFILLVGFTLLISLLALFVNDKFHSTRVVGTRAPDIDGEVMEVSLVGSIIKLRVEDRDGKDKGNLAFVNIIDNTRIFRMEGTEYVYLSKQEYVGALSMRTKVWIFFNDPVKLSYPSRGSAREIIIFKE